MSYSSSTVTPSTPTLGFGSQTRDTVSATRTVSYTYNLPGAPIGQLETAGPDADDFWIVSHNCASGRLPGGVGQPTTCTAKLRSSRPLKALATPSCTSQATPIRRLLSTAAALPRLRAPTAPTATPARAAPAGPTAPTARTARTAPTARTARAAAGPSGKNGKDGKDGKDGQKGDTRVVVKYQHDTTRVGCHVSARGTGSRIVCAFNRRASRSWTVQLRDRRGALSAARGTNQTTMVFLSKRKPAGAMHTYITERLPAS